MHSATLFFFPYLSMKNTFIYFSSIHCICNNRIYFMMVFRATIMKEKKNSNEIEIDASLLLLLHLHNVNS